VFATRAREGVRHGADQAHARGDRDSYAVTHRQVGSKLVVGTFAPGAVVSVRVDPGNVAEVMIA
jgi:hypothetical protein